MLPMAFFRFLPSVAHRRLRLRQGRAAWLRPLGLLAALGLTAQVLAAPAPWYWWRSKVDGAHICAQTSPGSGWERDSEPYAGPGCAPKPRVFVIPMR